MARTKGVKIENVTTRNALKNLPPKGSNIDGKSLTQKAMLINLSISQWTARKHDTAATKRVAEDFGNAAATGRYNKLLIAQDALKKIASTVTAARTFYYSNTLPWTDDGNRMLPATSYMEFTDEMRRLRNLFNNAVDDFEANYPALIEQARDMLAGLFNPDDYPSAAQIRRKYAFNFDVSPLPAAEDFRVMLQGDEVEQIQRSITERAEQRVNTAMADLYERLYKVVSKAADSLKDPKAIFHDTLIGNIVEITELLPKLNIANDPALEELRKIVEAKLCHTEPVELRKDINVRKVVADDAQAILDAMSAYMGG